MINVFKYYCNVYKRSISGNGGPSMFQYVIISAEESRLKGFVQGMFQVPNWCPSLALGCDVISTGCRSLG